MAYMQMYIHSLSTSMRIHGRLSLARGHDSSQFSVIRISFTRRDICIHDGGIKPPDWAIRTDKARVIFIRRLDLVRGISISEVGFITSLD